MTGAKPRWISLPEPSPEEIIALRKRPDWWRVKTWWATPDRRPAQTFFTAGPEREIARMIERMEAAEQKRDEAEAALRNRNIDGVRGLSEDGLFVCQEGHALCWHEGRICPACGGDSSA